MKFHPCFVPNNWQIVVLRQWRCKILGNTTWNKSYTLIKAAFHKYRPKSTLIVKPKKIDLSYVLFMGRFWAKTEQVVTDFSTYNFRPWKYGKTVLSQWSSNSTSDEGNFLKILSGWWFLKSLLEFIHKKLTSVRTFVVSWSWSVVVFVFFQRRVSENIKHVVNLGEGVLPFIRYVCYCEGDVVFHQFSMGW